MADQASSDMDESAMFLSAVGGPSHGRIRGLGGMLQNNDKTATTRCRAHHIASSISGVTNNGVQSMFSSAEVGTLLAERDRRQDEEKAEFHRKLSTFESQVNQLFQMVSLLRPMEVRNSILMATLFFINQD